MAYRSISQFRKINRDASECRVARRTRSCAGRSITGPRAGVRLAPAQNVPPETQEPLAVALGSLSVYHLDHERHVIHIDVLMDPKFLGDPHHSSPVLRPLHQFDRLHLRSLHHVLGPAEVDLAPFCGVFLRESRDDGGRIPGAA